MNEEKKYEEAFEFIFERAIPNEAELDRMNQGEVEEYLADSGVDLEEFKKRRAEKRRYFSGRFALLQAKQERLRKKEQPEPAIEVPKTKVVSLNTRRPRGLRSPSRGDRSQSLRHPSPDAKRANPY